MESLGHSENASTQQEGGVTKKTTDALADYNREQMDTLYEETFKNLVEGTIIEGEIIAIEPDGVMVDIGYKSEGMIPLEEFSEESVKDLSVGQKVTVYLQEREDSDGNLVLSKEKAEKMKIWKELEASYNKGEVVEGKILSRIKGGMIVDIGVKAFLPGSQVDLRPVRDLDQLVGKAFPMKIIKMNQKVSWWMGSLKILPSTVRLSIWEELTVCFTSPICPGGESAIPPPFSWWGIRFRSLF